MPYSKLTSEQQEEMKSLSEQGMSSAKLGKRFGMHHTTILYWLGKTTKSKKTKKWKKDKTHFFSDSPCPVVEPPKPPPPEPKEIAKYCPSCEEIVKSQSKIELIRDKKGNVIKVIKKL